MKGEKVKIKSNKPKIKNPCNHDHAWTDGSCCCNCKHHRKLMSHPWSNGLPVHHQMGWVCVMFLSMEYCENPGVEIGTGTVIFTDLHGMCEMYYNKQFQDKME